MNTSNNSVDLDKDKLGKLSYCSSFFNLVFDCILKLIQFLYLTEKVCYRRAQSHRQRLPVPCACNSIDNVCFLKETYDKRSFLYQEVFMKDIFALEAVKYLYT